MSEFRRFRGTDRYLTNDALEAAVNCALALERPLLVKGEPGTGKTLLAEAIAASLGAEIITWNVKSTTRAQDGLYVYDTVQRLYDLTGQLELLPIIDSFRRPGVTFLMPSQDVELTDRTIIDISHESLMRVWTRLRHWVEAETGMDLSGSRFPRLQAAVQRVLAQKPGTTLDREQIAQVPDSRTSERSPF